VKVGPKKLSYVLITAARNEEAHIEKTIRSVISQTFLPKRWVIVNDGSKDGTVEIVKRYLSEKPWIELIQMPEHRDRQFAAKVKCFSAGYERVKDIRCDVIGNLDADISFEKDYLEFLLNKFVEMPKLGVAGTPFLGNGYSSVTDSFEGERHVAGGCQLFRRECFEEIGGYIPNKAGGIDWIAVTTARMRGWKTQSFREKYFYHHRALGTGGRGPLEALFSYGEKDYYLGNHPIWEMFRTGYRTFKKPYVVGGLTIMLGYLWAFITRMEKPVSRELMLFHRREEMEKLRLILRRMLKFRKIDQFSLRSD
jgi:glycosyltransferase involved in cell wall biosynthesis